MKTTLYRVFKIKTVAKINLTGLTVAKANGELVNLQQIGQYQNVKQVKALIKIDRLNNKSNGLKFTKPIVHSDKKYLVVKLGA